LQSFEKIQMTPATIYSNVVTAARKHPEVDAIYVQSGTMATVGLLERMEQVTGKPIVSSNSANIGLVQAARHQGRQRLRKNC